MKTLATVLCLGALIFVVTVMLAPTMALASGRINTDTQGLAINGYDPVAYFTQGKPLKGSEQFAYPWMGAEWRFASAEHLDLFKSDPEKYAPQYGGY